MTDPKDAASNHPNCGCDATAIAHGHRDTCPLHRRARCWHLEAACALSDLIERLGAQRNDPNGENAVAAVFFGYLAGKLIDNGFPVAALMRTVSAAAADRSQSPHPPRSRPS